MSQAEPRMVEAAVILCEDSLEHMTSKTSSNLLDSSSMSATERRKVPRYGFVAVADLSDPEDGKLVSGRVTQISRSGCYVESPKTFPVGTSLKVIVFRDEHTFVAKASIIHIQEQMGMGIASSIR